MLKKHLKKFSIYSFKKQEGKTTSSTRPTVSNQPKASIILDNDTLEDFLLASGTY